MKIAVVIPALDEEEQIAGAIETAQAAKDSSRNSGLQGVDRVEIEVVVVDAGSLDRTVRLAQEAGARVLVSERGRARQLEAGWRAVSADVVLFLHADTRLPAAWAQAVASSLRDASHVGGAFRLRLDASDKALRVVEFFARLRVALMGLPYGDQAIFVRRSALEKIGGVPAVPIMEDLDLIRAMKKKGRIEVLRLEVRTSARRYLDHGIARTTFTHLVALAAWRLGIDRSRVAAWCGR
ncbi:MAG: TIGR04283 family arsenosugar biosynthesis glycosyltransferase [Myxococcota bacterium]|nr:TIGR04283 family arsenosugar biosynthesis glycosyltransferase [Myxococcota bacterium]